MADSSLGSSQYINWNNSKYQSNEDTDIKTFQRTKSAQVIRFGYEIYYQLNNLINLISTKIKRTLDDATALLKSTDIDN